jgi:hypothetical protein
MVSYNWLHIECAKWSHLGRSGIVLCLNCGKKSLTQIVNSCHSSLCLYVIKSLVKFNANVNGLVEFYLPSVHHYELTLTLENFWDFKDIRIIKNLNCYAGNSLFIDDLASLIGLFTASMFCTFSKVNFRKRFIISILSMILCREPGCISSLSHIGLSMSMSLFCIPLVKFPCNVCYIPEYLDGGMRSKLGLVKICLQASSNPSCSSIGLSMSHTTEKHIAITKGNNNLDFKCRKCRCKRVVEVVVEVVVFVVVSVSVSVTSKSDIVHNKVCGICSNCSNRKSCHYWNYRILSMSGDRVVFSFETGLGEDSKYLHRINYVFCFSCPDTSRLSKYILGRVLERCVKSVKMWTGLSRVRNFIGARWTTGLTGCELVACDGGQMSLKPLLLPSESIELMVINVSYLVLYLVRQCVTVALLVNSNIYNYIYSYSYNCNGIRVQLKNVGMTLLDYVCNASNKLVSMNSWDVLNGPYNLTAYEWLPMYDTVFFKDVRYIKTTIYNGSWVMVRKYKSKTGNVGILNVSIFWLKLKCDNSEIDGTYNTARQNHWYYCCLLESCDWIAIMWVSQLRLQNKTCKSDIPYISAFNSEMFSISCTAMNGEVKVIWEAEVHPVRLQLKTSTNVTIWNFDIFNEDQSDANFDFLMFQCLLNNKSCETANSCRRDTTDEGQGCVLYAPPKLLAEHSVFVSYLLLQGVTISNTHKIVKTYNLNTKAEIMRISITGVFNTRLMLPAKLRALKVWGTIIFVILCKSTGRHGAAILGLKLMNDIELNPGPKVLPKK